ncbi:hypothetical protein U1Q18_004434, partial [Sarracenia purpurea var. burkii]
DICEDDLLELEKDVEDIFIKENMEPSEVEASNLQQFDVQQHAEGEILENYELPEEW